MWIAPILLFSTATGGRVGSSSLDDPSLMLRWSLIQWLRKGKILVGAGRDFSKILCHCVSTFVQSYEHQLQLVMGLFAVMLHMLYANKPFGYSIPSARLLHWYETTSIAVLFFVMWCGMYFSSDIFMFCTRCMVQFLGVDGDFNSVFVILLAGRVCSRGLRAGDERLARLWASARMLISSSCAGGTLGGRTNRQCRGWGMGA